MASCNRKKDKRAWWFIKMNNVGQFKAGTIFVGNVNHVKMKVLEIQKSNTYGCYKETALIKDLMTGRIFTYGLMALERCNVTILEEEKGGL